jgi:hypothetical protein
MVEEVAFGIFKATIRTRPEASAARQSRIASAERPFVDSPRRIARQKLD